MKKCVQRILSIVIVLSICLSAFTINASAFGGYMHWSIATLRMGLDDSINLSEDIKLAYKSGCLLADIGAVFMDNNSNFNTDGLAFTQAIYDLAMLENDELIEAFAFGWRDHYIHDNIGNANYLYYDNQTKGPYNNYHKNCGWIDEFFRDSYRDEDLNVSLVEDYPINGLTTNPIYVNYDLIQGAYLLLGESAPSISTINININAMCAAYDTFIFLNTKGWTDAQASRILLEALIMTFSSYGVNEASPSEIALNINEYNYEDLSFSEQVVSLFTEQDIYELTQYFTTESTQISSGEALLRITKNDIEGYNAVLNRIVSEKVSIVQNVDNS